MSQKRRQVIFPLMLRPNEMAQLRENIPSQQRSRVIRELLIREGYLNSENPPKVA
ncbi:hypothetical protein [Leptolyngbya sp. GGD]|uniref:hypothetical protein n=1 Tax=Leptolyngbya sp. GGD TaxID=2997907 RepID=UPI00227BB8E1|nr:hypothetical protein [Leptolyngbya sp. GGD]MCY6492329.1 hypothetical protein [Leptolyngbya sp. GGD]